MAREAKLPVGVPKTSSPRALARLAAAIFFALIFALGFPVAFALPLSDDYSSYATGALPSDFPATNTPDDSATIAEDATTGNRFLKILPTASATEPAVISYALAPAATFGNIVWAQVGVNVPASETKIPFINLDGAFIAPKNK